MVARRKRAAPAKPKPTTEPRPADAIVAEPDWEQLLTDAAERSTAAGHWRRITDEMMDREILSSSNGHALQRLVMAYLVYDRCSKAVAIDGIVTAAAPGNSRAIDRLSIHYKAMREAEGTAERLEAQLGLSPGRRGKVGKVAKKRTTKAGADAFLGPKG